jgi:hypothetical protein
VDRAAGLGVAQDPEVVYERRRALVGGPVELDEDALDLQEIALQGIQEAAGLQVFRGGTAVNRMLILFRMEEQRVRAFFFSWNRRTTENVHRDPVFLDDISNTIPVRCNRTEPKQPKRRVAAIRRRQNGHAQLRPARIGEDRRHLGDLVQRRRFRFRRPSSDPVWLRFGLVQELPLDETVDGVKVPGWEDSHEFRMMINALKGNTDLSWPRP